MSWNLKKWRSNHRKRHLEQFLFLWRSGRISVTHTEDSGIEIIHFYHRVFYDKKSVAFLSDYLTDFKLHKTK